MWESSKNNQGRKEGLKTDSVLSVRKANVSHTRLREEKKVLSGTGQEQGLQSVLEIESGEASHYSVGENTKKQFEVKIQRTVFIPPLGLEVGFGKNC